MEVAGRCGRTWLSAGRGGYTLAVTQPRLTSTSLFTHHAFHIQELDFSISQTKSTLGASFLRFYIGAMSYEWVGSGEGMGDG